MLFISIRYIIYLKKIHYTFQSHNWDAFHFNEIFKTAPFLNLHGFNLIIEMLFISIRNRKTGSKNIYHLFQSHNWDAFHFNAIFPSSIQAAQTCFNLIIEMLFISILPIFPRGLKSPIPSFNLIIEMLFISITPLGREGAIGSTFQSHNWDAFHFNWLWKIDWKIYYMFQSHNWDAFHFNNRSWIIICDNLRRVSIS